MIIIAGSRAERILTYMLLVDLLGKLEVDVLNQEEYS